MRGIGGPLLSIGDLVSDIGEPNSNSLLHSPKSPAAAASASPHQPQPPPHLQPSDLSTLFQENYDQLNKALAGTDHSWTSLTLKLCATLDTAKKLIESTNSNVMDLSEKVEDLERIIKKGDSAIAEVWAFIMCLNGSHLQTLELPIGHIGQRPHISETFICKALAEIFLESLATLPGVAKFYATG